MSTRGIMLMAVALCALIVNYSSRPVSNKTGVSEITIKLCALAVVFVCIMLLMIFGK